MSGDGDEPRHVGPLRRQGLVGPGELLGGIGEHRRGTFDVAALQRGEPGSCLLIALAQRLACSEHRHDEAHEAHHQQRAGDTHHEPGALAHQHRSGAHAHDEQDERDTAAHARARPDEATQFQTRQHLQGTQRRQRKRW